MSVYEILRPYRGHRHGARVEMVLDRMIEERAIRRGAVLLIERSTPCLVEGSYRLPNDAADAAGRGADAHQDSDQVQGQNGA